MTQLTRLQIINIFSIIHFKRWEARSQWAKIVLKEENFDLWRHIFTSWDFLLTALILIDKGLMNFIF